MPNKEEYCERFLYAFTQVPYRVALFEQALQEYDAGHPQSFQRRCDMSKITSNHDSLYLTDSQTYWNNLVDSVRKAIEIYTQNAG
ncbi:hypothetical protein [Butyrivibrio sp.]|uniref:hypothetical protein n=1 Tax=Butyrivibrio sp. TaxID=28121 RepID=UPI0025C685B7|nr:hypothetical protein [Butyrivibrio sp.]MBQ7431364.1 hypothetical protein [Butyrivibrio sp.]MBQ9302696.1 hypothetical protein [Butyrivibrio sp.]